MQKKLKQGKWKSEILDRKSNQFQTFCSAKYPTKIFIQPQSRIKAIGIAIYSTKFQINMHDLENLKQVQIKIYILYIYVYINIYRNGLEKMKRDKIKQIHRCVAFRIRDQRDFSICAVIYLIFLEDQAPHLFSESSLPREGLAPRQIQNQTVMR